ncbi:hypothetical protein HCN51_33340 [Nonomuraea sp. FMUSA5-5]|uniref:Core-binding (CB) domain-containing protein n=1 Tax=Nonomuraea composti TaxID=2720023 RepID=A0ABX1BCM7_9ACTN|nr:hypothetical protein [Nonomuraea sp. FMUSA5-5]NJP94267.1 hypothetical protein [Nonomuraea sp. FMUSA5-5]
MHQRELPAPYEALLRSYETALAHSHLAPSSRTVYLRRVRAYLAWIAAATADGRLPDGRLPDGRIGDGRCVDERDRWPVGEPLADMAAAVGAARAYHRALTARCSPRTADGVLAAVEDFHARLRLGGTGIPRRPAPQPLAPPPG